MRQLGEGEGRVLLHKSAPDIGNKRGILVSNGQGQPVCASPKRINHIPGLLSLDPGFLPFFSPTGFTLSCFYGLLCPFPSYPTRFPALRTLARQAWGPALLIGRELSSPTSTLNILNNNSHLNHHLLHLCFRTGCFIHIV